jgi:hypothetical protein
VSRPNRHEENPSHDYVLTLLRLYMSVLPSSGGHQMLSSFTAPYNFTPTAGRNYFRFGWPSSGSVLVTSFGVRVVATGQNVEFVEGLFSSESEATNIRSGA